MLRFNKDVSLILSRVPRTASETGRKDRKECYCRIQYRKTECKPSATFDMIRSQWTP